MKNIIVPTDFSKNANNALRFAINIANHFESNIHLIHVYNIPTQTGMVKSIKDFMEKDAEKGLTKTVVENKDRLFHKTNIISKAFEGFTDSAITNYGKAINADLIVMGTQGASGLKSVFLGSNTTAIIKNSETPVLVVPNDCKYRPFKDITLAVDHEIVGSDTVVAPLLELAEKYKSHINVLHVDKELVGEAIDTGVDFFLTNVPHSYNTIYESNIKKGIDNFVEKIDANLLCMIHRKRGFFENLFHRSVVNREAFDSPVPLLVLYDNY